MVSTQQQQQQQHITPLDRYPGLYLLSPTPKGRGVFTSQPIRAGTTIDVCAVLVLPPRDDLAHTALHHYTYNWPCAATQAVVFGLGSMFNHSSEGQNVGWRRDLARELIVYSALRDIEAGEELCISYGGHLTFEDVEAGHATADAAEDEEEALRRIEVD